MPVLTITCNARGAGAVIDALRAAGVTADIKTLVDGLEATITAEHDEPQSLLDHPEVRFALARARPWEA